VGFFYANPIASIILFHFLYGRDELCVATGSYIAVGFPKVLIF